MTNSNVPGAAAFIVAICWPAWAHADPSIPYPLCPGMWDQAAAPVAQSFKGGAPAATLLAQLGGGGSIGARPDTTQPPKSLPRDLKNLRKHPDLDVRNSVQELQANMKRIRTPEQQTQAEAAFAALRYQASIGRTPPIELAEQVKVTSAKTQLASMAGVVDPRTVEGYVGARPDTIPTKDLLRRTGELEFQVFSLQVAALSKLRGDEVKMVGVGEGGRPGGLNAVPAGRQVAWGQTEKGELCLRPTQPPRL